MSFRNFLFPCSFVVALLITTGSGYSGACKLDCYCYMWVKADMGAGTRCYRTCTVSPTCLRCFNVWHPASANQEMEPEELVIAEWESTKCNAICSGKNPSAADVVPYVGGWIRNFQTIAYKSCVAQGD